MPWVHFTKDHNWNPLNKEGRKILGQVFAYKAGVTELVKGPCAEEAMAKGAARRATATEIDEARSEGRGSKRAANLRQASGN